MGRMQRSQSDFFHATLTRHGGHPAVYEGHTESADLLPFPIRTVYDQLAVGRAGNRREKDLAGR